MKTITLAHYYTIPEVQEMADFVGDSLDLSLAAQNSDADRIVFAGVRFMAETAKLLNPNAEVIIPDFNATCSLVEQTDIEKLIQWDTIHREQAEIDDKNVVHVMYINSSVEMKSVADIIVTSRNVEDIIRAEIDKGNNVIFSPDYNMGTYLNHVNGWNMPIWSAVCDVHDKFNLITLEQDMLKVMRDSNHKNIPQLIAHPESQLNILTLADFVGSTSKMLQWIINYDEDNTIFVATEDGILYNMRKARPDLDIRQAPTYKGCQCNSCPFMKLNTIEAVKHAIAGTGGTVIELDRELIDMAIDPIYRMLEYK